MKSVGPGIEISAIGIDDIPQIDETFSPNKLSIFGSPQHFITTGFGECARFEGNVVAVASSYAISSRMVEVAIATHPDFRRRGIATAVSAAMLVSCIKKNLDPHWNAGNERSSQVARKLGFTYAGEVPLLYLPA